MLLKRAMGFEYVERTIKKFRLKGRLPKGAVVSVPAEEVMEATKYIVPDVKAATFWLTNRNPDRWQMVRKLLVDGHTSHTQITQDTAHLKDMSAEQLRALRDVIAASSNNDGTAIPVECATAAESGIVSEEVKMLENFRSRADKIIEGEIAEELESEPIDEKEEVS